MIHNEQQAQQQEQEQPTWYVYLLISVNNKCTYIGASNNPERRLRCHNGELVGGAKITKRNRPWRHVCVIGKMDKISALQLEWRLKRRPLKGTNKLKGFSGVQNKINNIYDVLNLEKWTSKAVAACNIPLEIDWSHPDFMQDNNKLPIYVRQYCSLQ